MSKYTSTTMLRTRRKDNNVKPNRRLDRKSSRGMIYENEELRLRTININAEIERGQYDIKKLKRENEMLKKEIWCLRDEYDKLDKLLKDKEYLSSSSSSSSSSTGSDSESCTSCTEHSEEVETSQNLQNMKNLRSGEFDHLSVVPEENSTETSDRTSVPPNDQWIDCGDVIKPDQSYPNTIATGQQPPKNFFSPIKPASSEQLLAPLDKADLDLILKTDNQHFTQTNQNGGTCFSNGGNLEELLNDIETISQDILKISTNDQIQSSPQKPYKSELSVVLMPNPMPLLGFDKYNDLKTSFENIGAECQTTAAVTTAAILPTPPSNTPPPTTHNPFTFDVTAVTQLTDDSSDYFNRHYNPDNFTANDSGNKNGGGAGSKTNLLEVTSSELVSSENEENLKFKTSKVTAEAASPQPVSTATKSPKMSIRRKVSIHFKGNKKDTGGSKKPFFDLKFGHAATASVDKTGDNNVTNVSSVKRPSMESRKSTTDAEQPPTTSSESKSDVKQPKTPSKIIEDTVKSKDKVQQQQRKSVSISPDRNKHVHLKEESRKHKKHKRGDRSRNRRGTVTSVDRMMNRERSYSACTERSIDHRYFYDSDRERTNSMSSNETIKTRKMSSISNIPLNGKVPWCGCWGNGCL